MYLLKCSIFSLNRFCLFCSSTASHCHHANRTRQKVSIRFVIMFISWSFIGGIVSFSSFIDNSKRGLGLMFFENKKTYMANFTDTIKSLSFWGFWSEESFLFRYFANAPYDVVLEFLGGICHINSKKIWWQNYLVILLLKYITVNHYFVVNTTMK